ncbi:unnamed protein product [Adineta ricciae]|uniref:Uncharacterized protein n=1 Tax=Adineta ricciae TaxID=249248 RepID=A0A815VT10_ADIRI|nr:unnamed protein product [Adineta ricciae]CAF1539664.1 unnamed protein product [Adineta ricciae]
MGSSNGNLAHCIKVFPIKLKFSLIEESAVFIWNTHQNHLLSLFSSSSIQSSDDESDSSVDSGDEIIEGVIRMLDSVIDITNLTDEDERKQTGNYQYIVADSTAVASRSSKCSNDKDESFENARSKRCSWTTKEKLVATKYFKQCKAIVEE